MPTYSYRCTECDHAFDIQQSFTDDSLSACPECGGKLRKVFNNIAVTFNGSGFYRTDSRTQAGGGKSGSGDPAKSSGSNGSASSGSSGGDSSATSAKEKPSAPKTPEKSSAPGSASSTGSGASTAAGSGGHKSSGTGSPSQGSRKTA